MSPEKLRATNEPPSASAICTGSIGGCLLTSPRFAFEPTSADVPNLAVEYLNESLYQSPGLPYADKGYNGNPNVGYDYVPAAWNLRAGETPFPDAIGDTHAQRR